MDKRSKIRYVCSMILLIIGVAFLVFAFVSKTNQTNYIIYALACIAFANFLIAKMNKEKK